MPIHSSASSCFWKFHPEQSSLNWIAIPREVVQLNMGVFTHLKTLKDFWLCTDQKLIQIQMHNKSEAFLCDISHGLSAALALDTQSVHFVLCVPLQRPASASQAECLGSESRLSCAMNYIYCARSVCFPGNTMLQLPQMKIITFNNF